VSLRDADDTVFVACAYEARADFIVTGNIKDFAGVSNVKVLTPREFLISIAAEFFGT
jgi:predicted nucleic acid-binding protein